MEKFSGEIDGKALALFFATKRKEKADKEARAVVMADLIRKSIQLRVQ